MCWRGVDWSEGLQTLWEEAIRQGKTRSVVPPFVVYGMSPGRLRWAEETLTALWQGAISP